MHGAMSDRALPHVDPEKRRGLVYRAFARLTATRAMGWVSRGLVWKLDPVLMRITRGRFGFGMMLPTALLETRGARSGEPRRNAVIYFHDGERVTIVASKLGLPKHPAWFHNLCAHPDVEFGGAQFRAHIVDDEAERERLWRMADQVFPGYAAYRQRAAEANRTIPIVQLVPR
jgi:deazaflavin-dependent oxidoreductase (nitroreductase family)